jgi:amino acid adenylation domain-containing protein
MKRLDELLVHSAEHSPLRKALKDIDGKSYNYRQIQQSAQAYAKFLQSASFQNFARIGLISDKKYDSYCALWGILSAGFSYVPISAHHPAERIRYILHQAGAEGVIIEREKLDLLDQDADRMESYAFPFDADLVLVRLHTEQMLITEAEAPAFILFTSGSTGKPKGVSISHAAALAFALWAGDRFLSDSAQETVVSIAPWHFDLSVFDIFSSAYRAAELVLWKDDVLKNPAMAALRLDADEISCIYATPTLLNSMVQFGKLNKYAFVQLKTILFAGEVYPIIALQKALTAWPEVSFYNLYGPTETNVCTFHQVDRTDAMQRTAPLPIGMACPYDSCMIIDELGHQVKESNVDGELVVNGASVMQGYWNDQEKTDAAWHFDESGKRFYKTGDLVFQDEEGRYNYRGRRDRMLKRRGYRIELAEVEDALSRIINVVDAAAVSISGKDGNPQIIAYLSFKTKEVQDSISLRIDCLQYLPDYMLPDQFIILAELPRNSSGKIDLQALTQMANL